MEKAPAELTNQLGNQTEQEKKLQHQQQKPDLLEQNTEKKIQELKNFFPNLKNFPLNKDAIQTLTFLKNQIQTAQNNHKTESSLQEKLFANFAELW